MAEKKFDEQFRQALVTAGLKDGIDFRAGSASNEAWDYIFYHRRYPKTYVPVLWLDIKVVDSERPVYWHITDTQQGVWKTRSPLHAFVSAMQPRVTWQLVLCWVLEDDSVKEFNFNRLDELVIHLIIKVLSDRERYWEEKFPAWHERVKAYMEK